jgi:NADPH:quinone reductase
MAGTDTTAAGAPGGVVRRIVIDAAGPSQVMRTISGPLPDPAGHEVLVTVAAAGVNVVDLYQRDGTYSVPFPWFPGFEGSGVVLRTGSAVTDFAAGDRVAWAGAPGSYATHCTVPAQRLVPVPDGLSLTDAAAVLVQGMTAHFLAHDVVPLHPGDSVLVHAAAGGVGGLLCQLAAARGVTVIGTVSHRSKADAARRSGADHVVDYGAGGFAEQVRNLTGGKGVDVVYDAVGKGTFAEGLDCLRPRGTFVLYGQTGGAVDAVAPQALNSRGSLFFTKASLGHYDTTREQMLERAGAVFSLVQEGALRVRVHDSRPLDEAATAHDALQSRTTLGKLLLVP